MKATVVVNSMTIDILFLWGDEVFAKHIHKVAVESGFTKESFQGLDSIDLSSIAHIFSPMIASFSHMNDLGNPYQSVTCQDGTLFVFRQFDNLTFFAISNSGEESEEFLQRKLSVVHNLAVMYFGASLEMLKPEVRSARNRIWKFLGSLIDTWEELCSQQQSFLVEAVERISVNQSLSEMAVSLLDSALSVSKNKGDQNTMHTLLLVNSKLLALYSSRNASELQAADILMITLFAQSVFPHTSAVIPYSSNRTPPPLAYQTVCKGSPSSIDQIITNTSNGTPHVSNSSRLRWPASKPITISKSSQEAAESLNSSLEDTFYSPPSTPSTEELSTPSSLEAITQASGVLQEEYFSPRAHTPEHKDSQNHRKQSLPEEEHSDSSSQDSVPPPAANVQEYYRQPGFLHASNCPYIPHILHFVYIAEGTVLVLVSEVRHGFVAVPIHQALEVLSRLEVSNDAGLRGPQFAQATMDRLESCIKRISEILKASLGTAVDQRVRILRDNWNSVKRGDLQCFLATNREELPPNLEAGVGRMIRNLKSLFSVLYCTGRDRDSTPSDKHLRAICQIQENLKTRLSDYGDYLQVKGQRNVTMTAYLEDFPGLVHFIYVDRSSDQVVAPSINTSPGKVRSSRDPCHVLKQKIWDMWTYAHSFVLRGHTFVAVRDGDFLYTYCLWFEDSFGNPAVIQGSFPLLEEQSLAGILSGSRGFYKDLIRRCFPAAQPGLIRCYELMCVHVSLVPVRFAARHLRRLSSALFETTLGSHYPISLIQ